MKHILYTDTNIIFVGDTKVAYPLNGITYVQNGKNITFYDNTDYLGKNSIFTVDLPFDLNGNSVTEDNVDIMLSALFINSGSAPSPTPSGKGVTSEDIDNIVVGNSADYDPSQQNPRTLYILL